MLSCLIMHKKSKQLSDSRFDCVFLGDTEVTMETNYSIVLTLNSMVFSYQEKQNMFASVLLENINRSNIVNNLGLDCMLELDVNTCGLKC